MPLDLNYHHLYYFWVSVRCGSLTSASRELELSQSALSLQLKSLEGALGRRLLVRSRTGVAPTAEGREVFERCERIFPEGEALTRALRSDSPRAPLQYRVGVGSGLGRDVVLAVLDRIAEVPRLIPTVHVGPGDAVLQRLMRHQLDVALFSGDHSAELGPAYRCRRLATVPLRFVCAPELAKRLGSFSRRGREVPMLLHPVGHAVRVKAEQWMREHGLKALTVAETADAELLRVLALQGRGVAVVHQSLVRDDVADGRLLRIPGSPADLFNEIWAASPLRPPVDEEPRRAGDLIMGMGPILVKAAPERSAKK